MVDYIQTLAAIKGAQTDIDLAAPLSNAILSSATTWRIIFYADYVICSVRLHSFREKHHVEDGTNLEFHSH